MIKKMTAIIHGLSAILRIQNNIKEQNDKIEYNQNGNIKKFHEYDMRLVKIETTLETMFTMTNSNRGVYNSNIKSLKHEE